MFENLDVYQKAVELADQVLIATSEFPRGFYFLSDQLNRASVSNTANIAEGNGHFTIPDCKMFFDDRQRFHSGMRGADGNSLSP